MDTTGLFILKDKNIVPYEIKEKKVILCGVLVHLHLVVQTDTYQDL